MLDPLDPRLRGPLADEDLLGPERLVDCIELDVACDAPTLLDLLARFGQRAAPLTEGPTWLFLVDSFGPVEITLRSGKARSDEHTCDAAELAARLRRLPSSLRLQVD